ncbi:hypothetical protein XM38_027910 [Halomicronema hongdechloris C2206]|uniref:DUF2281 domain-containing protein n=1 Tax=Halomicronema hongdechloris C2206 TaxID=1641165 RepID=A0A1Z3HNV3_9CYAN|nr:hypothetical protein [Halomicronema hongdechloris]ASC71837.1 hypothetical protein XM38_027910 [Halomicronema hongdechloris C2206]
MTLDDIFALVRQLSVLDQVKLIERIAPEIERALQNPQTLPRKSLWGICVDLGDAPSDTDITEARNEAWANFPRDAM